jgi:hypothetical protein
LAYPKAALFGFALSLVSNSHFDRLTRFSASEGEARSLSA